MARRAGEKRGPGLREDKPGSIERQGLLLRGEREREDGGMRDAAGSHSFTSSHQMCVCVCVCQYIYNWQQRPLACLLPL